MIPFGLRPFSPDDACVQGVEIAGYVELERAWMRVQYRVRARAGSVEIPGPSSSEGPRRRDELWRSTCMELFVGVKGEEGYVEINVAPSGDWNVYRFDRYREGMAPVEISRFWPAAVGWRGEEEAVMGFAMELPLLDERPLELTPAAVLAHAGGERSYWSIAHRGEKPDFHRRDAFVIRL